MGYLPFSKQGENVRIYSTQTGIYYENLGFARQHVLKNSCPHYCGPWVHVPPNWGSYNIIYKNYFKINQMITLTMKAWKNINECKTKTEVQSIPILIIRVLMTVGDLALESWMFNCISAWHFTWPGAIKKWLSFWFLIAMDSSQLHIEPIFDYKVSMAYRLLT